MVAHTYDEAKNSVIKVLGQKGYVPVGEVKPYPCPVQPWNEVVWWEYVCEVEETGVFDR